MYRTLPRPLSHLRQYATRAAAAPPPPKKLSFTERLRNRLWRPGALPPSDPEPDTDAAPEPAILKPTDTPGYAAAIDARDLPVVGLAPGPEEWDVPVFTTNKRFHRHDAIHRAVHRATVEIHTRLLNGLAADTFRSGYTGPEALTPLVRIAVSSGSGGAAFDFQTAAIEQAILAAGTGTDAGTWEEVRPYTEDELYPLQDHDQGWVGVQRGARWTGVRLRDDDVRFALVKRVAQLTGIRVADADASRVRTVADLLGHLETKPKPQKLYEVIAAGPASPLPALPNVKVYEKRVRPWDKERMIGRERPFEKAVEFRYPFEVRGRK